MFGAGSGETLRGLALPDRQPEPAMRARNLAV
jgi:hypothetical protein